MSLPAGDHRLHVRGQGRLSRIYRFGVTRGETTTHEISLDEGRLLGGERSVGFGGDERQRDVPIHFAPFITSIELTKGKSDLIEWSGNSVVRRDGATGEVRWDTSHPTLPFRPNQDPAPWIRDYSGEDKEVRLVELAPDSNGDGTGDLLWFFPGTSAFLAQSGENGSMLWNCAAGLDEKGGFQATGLDLSRMDTATLITGQIIGVPALADIDRDGVPDLIATIIFAESDVDAARRQPQIFHRRLVMAISSRSGRALWTYPLDQAFADVPRESWERPAVLVQGRHPALVGILDGTQWLGLDPTTGRPQAGPFPMGFSPFRRLQHADLDGDGQPEILALDLGPGGGHNTLHAFSIKTGRELWAEKVGATSDIARYAGATPDFPMTADLDDDGRVEIVVADSGLMPPLAGYRGVKLLDGLTGKPRWQRPMRPDTIARDGLIEAIAAPDLDGDGTRDLITISLYYGKNLPMAPRRFLEDPAIAYVDAISGKDGRPLWLWHIELPLRKFTRIWPLHWWGRSHDGWPLLAVPLGGSRPDGVERNYGRSVLNPPVVHLLEASTGIERHTVDGLNRAHYADLDGDGLADLWGEVDGELRAFRGEAPEAWRALGRFEPEYPSFGAKDLIRGPAVDFDGDGVADTLIRTGRGQGAPRMPAFSRTAQARSGRDGHVIWTTTLDPAASWLEPGRTDWYYFTALPPPFGDLSGDGTPDVIVHQSLPPSRGIVVKQSATLPIQVLSGRTGAFLWRAGPLPLGFDARGYSQIHSIKAAAVEAGAAPDLFVRHGHPFVKPGSAPPVPKTLGPRARAFPVWRRISGRDGRILWNIPLVDGVPADVSYDAPPDQLADLDGDGMLDTLMVVPPSPGAGSPDHTMVAVSLHAGRRLWSQPVHFQRGSGGEVRIADLDGDKQPDVVVMDELPEPNLSYLQVRVLSGSDGKVRWTWKSAADIQTNRPKMVLAQLDGNSTTNVCVSFKESASEWRFVVLDGSGNERARRETAGEEAYLIALAAADLNGDGRDDLLVWSNGRLRAWGPDLREAWSRPDQFASIDQVLPGSPGNPSALIITPALALDGATGQSRWTAQGAFTARPAESEPALLDPGNSTRHPLWLSLGMGATVCREALPTTSNGKLAPPRGTLIQPGRNPLDPRWARPLPWLAWLNGPFGLWGFLAATGLACVNVVLPLLILRLIAGRRRASIRALMAVPLAAALPLMAFLMLEPVLPVSSTLLLSSEKRIFTIGTLAGIPIVFCLFWMVRNLARLRWKPAALLIVLTAFVSLSIAAAWLWYDKKSMSPIERYASSGWYLVLLPGITASGLLILILVTTKAAFRFITRRTRTLP